MKIDEIMRALERAQAYAYPGREAAERDHVLRELHRLLQQPTTAREPMRLRLVQHS
jgi:hypothetical protein